MLYLFQKGFHYAQDGPGNRLIYHLQGCNIRCPWCSNPEGLAREGGTPYPVEELVDEVLRSRPMFFDGGGVTLTGGEVTLQADASLRLLSAVHEKGVSTCIETNGISERLPEFFPVVDHLIMDVKHHDPARHRAVTGASNEQTLKNLARAVEYGCDLLVRIPLIGGFNASAEDARAFASLFSELKVPSHAKVELLAYHEYGKSKYEKLGIPYTVGEDAKVTKENFEAFSQILQEAGITLIKT